MKLSKTFIFLALFTGATCAPDRLGINSDTSSGISDESRIGGSDDIRNYGNIAASDNTETYYLKRKDIPGSSSIKFTGGNKSKRSQVAPTKTLRFRRKPKKSPPLTKKMQLRVKPNHRAAVKSRDVLSGEVKSSTRAKSDLNLDARNAAEKNVSPTPAPTGEASDLTTVYITDENDFAILLPREPNERISDAESDGVAFSTASGGVNSLQQGFITAAAVSRSPDNSSWIQVTGCLNPSKFSFAEGDDGGQFDVRFPNGAQCSFGGYGASFIEQVEPSANRFCLRCCLNANDQDNCNSHQDRAGCPVAIPGIYDFPEKGISCS